MEKVKNPNNSVWYTPSSEPFKIYFTVNALRKYAAILK
jgi:hypothetical protein